MNGLSLILAAADPVLPTGGAAPLEALSPFMGVFFAAFFTAILVTPLMRRLAIRNGVIDWPDLKRKNHTLPVAYLGGVAIFIGWLAGILCNYLIAPEHVTAGGEAMTPQAFPISIILGAAVIVVTGLLDDVWGLRARTKIGGQLFAAAALTSQNVGMDLSTLLFGIVGIPAVDTLVYFVATFVVAFFVLGGCNAVNLLDGLDGLASGVVAIAMGGFLVLALLAGHEWPVVAYQNPTRIALCLATLGAILGFLPYNFQPARIFMGDAGSLFLGFLAATAILLFGDSGGLSLKLVVAALIIFALPITDTSLAIIRRRLRGQSLFAPDSQHLHHLLRKSGLSVRKTVLTLYAAGVVFAALGITLIALDLPLRLSLAFCCVLYGFILVTAFKYGSHCLAREKACQAAPPAAAKPREAPIVEVPTTPIRSV